MKKRAKYPTGIIGRLAIRRFSAKLPSTVESPANFREPAPSSLTRSVRKKIRSASKDPKCTAVSKARP